AWTSTRSRSLPGVGSWRPSAPTASRATPGPGSPRAAASHPSYRAVRACRSGAPVREPSTRSCLPDLSSRPLEGVRTTLPRADPDHLVDQRAPDLAVADRARASGLHDRVDDPAGVGVVGQHLDA